VSGAWPPLPYDAWKDTYATLHMWTQIVGKIALARIPPLNHSWGVAFHLTPRGITTQRLPHGARSFTLEFDFIDHQLVARASDGDVRTIALKPQAVADFYGSVMSLLREMALPVRIWPVAVEVPFAVRLDEDRDHHAYDPEAAARCWRIACSIADVLTTARAEFVGKSSPVHFFWGGFDLASTRFSGRPAPPREGPAFMREAYSHEVISHGFWPGGDLPGGQSLHEPVMYAYAVPEPAGLKDTRVRPDAAYYHAGMGEFFLPYDAVRTASSPERAIREFVDSTYDAAATLARWDRKALERA
jgi:hypothetical protein